MFSISFLHYLFRWEWSHPPILLNRPKNLRIAMSICKHLGWEAFLGLWGPSNVPVNVSPGEESWISLVQISKDSICLITMQCSYYVSKKKVTSSISCKVIMEVPTIYGFWSASSPRMISVLNYFGYSVSFMPHQKAHLPIPKSLWDIHNWCVLSVWKIKKSSILICTEGLWFGSRERKQMAFILSIKYKIYLLCTMPTSCVKGWVG